MKQYQFYAILTGAALGYVEKKGMEIPHVQSLGKAGTLGIALYLLSERMRSPALAGAATAALAIAANEFVRSGKWATKGDDDSVIEGDLE